MAAPEYTRIWQEVVPIGEDQEDYVTYVTYQGSPPPRQPITFLSLPHNARFKIYTFSLVTTARVLLRRIEVPGVTFTLAPSYGEMPPSDRPDLALLRSCRAIHDEAYEVLYANIFEITVPYHWAYDCGGIANPNLHNTINQYNGSAPRVLALKKFASRVRFVVVTMTQSDFADLTPSEILDLNNLPPSMEQNCSMNVPGPHEQILNDFLRTAAVVGCFFRDAWTIAVKPTARQQTSLFEGMTHLNRFPASFEEMMYKLASWMCVNDKVAVEEGVSPHVGLALVLDIDVPTGDKAREAVELVFNRALRMYSNDAEMMRLVYPSWLV